MRIGSMIRQLLEEVKSAPLDDASRNRLKEIHRSSIKELGERAGPELVEELSAVAAVPRTPPVGRRATDRPARLVGSLEGLSTASRPRSTPSRSRREESRADARAPPPVGARGHHPQEPGTGEQRTHRSEWRPPGPPVDFRPDRPLIKLTRPP